MKKRVNITTAVSSAIISLLIIPLYTQPLREPTTPEVPPVSPLAQHHRGNTPSTEKQAVVADEIPEISPRNPTQGSIPTETDYEPPTPPNTTEILEENNTTRDNPPPTPAPSKGTTVATVYEPKMGDIRTVNGQKQVYFLGFGWIDDNEEPNIGTLVEGDGDINKIVGIMD